MYDYKDLKIYLCDVSTSMCNAWRKSFKEAEGFHENIEIFEGSFHDFMQSHPDIDGIVSPANSYGLMDGGYDKAITEWFGTECMEAVQKAIIKEWLGEQPVGSCLIVQVPPHISVGQFILHTPTMRVPSIIEDPEVVYHCTRSCIMAALKAELNTIVVPAFGGCCGKVNHSMIADYMERAFYSFEDTPKELTWHYAYKSSPLGEYNPKEVTYD